MTNYKKYQESDSITISIEKTCISENSNYVIASRVAVKIDNKYVGYVLRHSNQRTWGAVFSIEDKGLYTRFIYETEHDAIKALVALSSNWRYF